MLKISNSNIFRDSVVIMLPKSIQLLAIKMEVGEEGVGILVQVQGVVVVVIH